MTNQNVAQPSAAGKSSLAVAIKFCENVNAGVLLCRIHYWDRSNLSRNRPDRWAANSYTEWSADTGLSDRQCERALAILKRMGVVEVKRTLFNNRNVLHVRLSPRGIGVFEPTTTGGFEPTKSGGFHIQEEPQEKPTEELHVQGHGSEIQPEEKGAGETDMGNTARDILNAMKAKKVEPVANTGAAMALLFKELYSAHTGKFAPNLSVKEMAWLKQFRLKCPGQTGIIVLEKVCKHWVEFTEEVKATTGSKMQPEAPSVWFLNTHAHIAISFTPKSEKPVTEVSVEMPEKKFSGFVMKPKAEH